MQNKEMLLIIAALAVFGGGYYVRGLLEVLLERRAIKKHYLRKKRVFDEKIQRNNSDIDNAPIEDLLEDGEYIQERRKQN